MPGIKLVVLYPPPTDAEAFDRAYREEHVPLAMRRLSGVTKFVPSKVLASPVGAPAFHQLVEIHFPSLDALQSCLSSPGGQETAAHAFAISSGGPPVFLITEEQAFA